MDSRQMINEQLKKKFHGKLQIESKYVPKFPESTERDYVRFMNEMFSETLKASLSECLPELIQILREAENAGAQNNQRLILRSDAKDLKEKQSKKNEKHRAKQRWRELDNTIIRLRRIFRTIRDKLDGSLNLYQVNRKLDIIANASRKLTVKEWKKAIGKTLGINILEDYYDGSFYSEILEKWVQENAELIKTISADALDDMEKIVLDSYLKGETVTEISKRIQRSYSMTKFHARLIARDQIGKLNCQITRYQQQSCGVNKYTWRTAGDGRVRDSHRVLDKKVFDWNHPPVVDKSGRRCHPGQDYQCRCVAIPVFDFGKLDLPVDGTADAGKKR